MSGDFSPVVTCKGRTTVMRCFTAPRASVPLRPSNFLLTSAKKRCGRKAASVAHAIIVKPAARRRGGCFATILQKALGLKTTEFLRNYANMGLSVLTERPL